MCIMEIFNFSLNLITAQTVHLKKNVLDRRIEKRNTLFQIYLFHSCFQCIRPRNHNDNFQQDLHMWLRFDMEQGHTR